MVAVNDILQITIFGTLQSREVVNVFHYQVADVDSQNSNLEAITQAWFVNFDTQILSLLATGMVYNRVSTLNLTDGIDLYEGSVNANGDITGDQLPVHDAMSVKLTRQTRITRNGRKSFAGIPESKAAQGGFTYLASELDQIEQFLSQPLDVDVNNDPADVVILNPVIVGRTLNASGKYELDLTKINNIIGAVVNPRIRTQKSRED